MPDFIVAGLSDEDLGLAAQRAGLALRVDELRRIAARLGRDPSIVEVHAFDAQWSEHCSYKSSRHLLRALPTEGPAVMQGPAEDAGILHLGTWNGERYGVVIAHESHNHPSQVVPFEGAATGVGGIVRDVLCMGAEVIAVGDALRFGRIEDPQSHQRYVAGGVVDGIAAYGNAIGVPNLAGDAYFDTGFDDNCLVNVVALGLVKESEIVHSAAPAGSAGWDIVLVGKATDRSGFGGAAFSSVTLDKDDEQANKGAVQVPDPFLKNVIMRATYRVFAYLRERGVTAGFKDLGAGGIMGCSAELCGSGGFGAILDLDDVSTAVSGLPPEVIAIGETQERLCWVLPGDVTAEVLRIYNDEFSLPQIARGACASVVGVVQEDRRYVLRHGRSVVMDVPIDFLTGSIHDDLAVRPMSERKADDPAHRYLVETPGLLELLPKVLSHRDVCSRAPIFEHYDGVVRGTTVIARGMADAGVIAPVFGAPFGVALAIAGNPRYGAMDPVLAAEHAVVQAVRAVVAVGARPLGLTDCLNFGNPRNVDHYSELVHAIDGLAAAARELATPFVSGNVSLYNESRSGSAIPASPIVAAVGAVDDLSRVVTMGFKRPGSTIFLFGKPHNAMGGSVVAECLGQTGGPIPALEYDAERRRIALLHAAAERGLLCAAKAVGNGGMLAGIAQMLFACGLGAELKMPAANGIGAVEWAFGESAGWILECVDDAALVALARAHGAEGDLVPVGTVRAAPELVIGSDRTACAALLRAWSAPLTAAYA